MKFGKITSAKVSHDAISLVGGLAGGAVSGGIMTFVPEKQKLLARGGMAGIGLLGAASLKGNTSAENLVKFALLGVAVAQGTALINHFASQQITIDENSTAANKFVGGMVGLGCPCDESQPALASPVINFPALRNADGVRELDFSNQEDYPVGAEEAQMEAFS